MNSWKPFLSVYFLSIEYKALCLAVALICAWSNFCVLLLSKNLLGFFYSASHTVCVWCRLFFYSGVIPFMLSFLKSGGEGKYLLCNAWKLLRLYDYCVNMCWTQVLESHIQKGDGNPKVGVMCLFSLSGILVKELDAYIREAITNSLYRPSKFCR